MRWCFGKVKYGVLWSLREPLKPSGTINCDQSAGARYADIFSHYVPLGFDAG